MRTAAFSQPQRRGGARRRRPLRNAWKARGRIARHRAKLMQPKREKSQTAKTSDRPTAVFRFNTVLGRPAAYAVSSRHRAQWRQRRPLPSKDPRSEILHQRLSLPRRCGGQPWLRRRVEVRHTSAFANGFRPPAFCYVRSTSIPAVRRRNQTTIGQLALTPPPRGHAGLAFAAVATIDADKRRGAAHRKSDQLLQAD